MALQRKISGLIDLPGATAKFGVTVRAFAEDLGVQKRARSGRGNRGWAKSRAFRPGGTLTLTGDVRMDGFPLPDQFKGQEGTIVLQFHSGGANNRTAKQTLSVRVDSAKISLAKDVEDVWSITLACTILSNPTLTGFGGTQPAATDPAKSVQELDDGLSKTHDPNNLQEAAQRSWDVWPLGDSDAAELERIADVIAAAGAPFPGAKVKTATLLPGRDDEGGTVTAIYSLTDTVEDVVNPITTTTLDTNGLTSSATAAAINQAPDGPGGDFVEVDTTTREIHDAATLAIKAYALRDSKDAVEMDGSSQTLDPNRIDSAATTTQVYDTMAGAGADPAAPSSELQLVARTVKKLNRKKSVRTVVFDPLTSTQKRTFPRTHAETDPLGLDDWQTTAVTYTTSAPEDPAFPPAGGLKLHTHFDEPITPERTLRVYLWRRLDTKDERTFPETNTVTDTSDLESVSASAVIYPSGPPPSDPTPASGMRLVFKKDHPVTDSATLRVYVFQKDSTAEKLLQPHAYTNTDASALRSTAARSQLDGSPTGPGGSFVQRNTRTFNATHDHVVTVNEYGLTTTQQDEEYGASGTTDDQQDLADEIIIAEVQGSSAPLAAPASPPANLKLRDILTKELTPAKWRHAYVYSRRTRADDLIMEAWEAFDDVGDLDETGRVLQITASVTPPAAPATPVAAGKLIATRSKQIHDTVHAGGTGKWAHLFLYGTQTSAEKVEQSQTVTRRDPIGPGEIAVATVIGSGDADWSDGSASGIGQAVFNRLATGSGADATFGGVEAVKLNTNKAVKKIITVPDSRIVRASSHAGTTEVKAWMLGSAVVVWVSDVVQRGTNQTWFYVESRSIRRMVKEFSIHRRVRASVINELVDYSGTSNAEPFLTFPRWTVTFAGIDIIYDRLITSPKLYDVAWKFRYDSAGQFDDTGVRLGWNFSNDDLGDVAAPSINFALRFGWPASMLPPADYTIFTDPAKESSLFT